METSEESGIRIKRDDIKKKRKVNSWLSKAYQFCLKLQAENVFTSSEPYFVITALLMIINRHRLLNRSNSILKKEKCKTATKQDFSADHRESKAISDSIADRQFTKKVDLKRLLIPSFQANNEDGELNIMELVALVLYTSRHIGSVEIPNNVAGLRVLRENAYED
ncbi:hypothetical protein RMATCC62417_11452 [Rhizopus microsporus]|nr:hypothetical protein RMATCC62417_11452 [Rhizopus microsporus]